ncbi:MAG TPA: pitrilysin family protein [Gemmataceae bacterium]|nr:pitrilysin family protein [Gemmataceae bacterium]
MRFCLALVAFAFIPPAYADDGRLFKTAQGLYDGVRVETLPNGLRVFLKPIPGAPIVSTQVAYLVGSADEDLDQTGLSHYLEHLMFKGTDKLLPGDIDRITQQNGGHNNAYTTEDMTVYHFDFAADRWVQALEIEAARMRGLRIDEKHEFQQEKGAVISELNKNEDDPWDLESKLVLPLLFGEKSPYGHPIIGEKAHVAAATAATIKAYYDRWYHPNNAVLVVAGGFDADKALETIKALFGPIPRGELPPRKAAPALKPRTETVRKKFDSKFPTPRLLIGFNTVTEDDADSVPLDIVAQLLTGGRTSRLHQRLIEVDGTGTSIDAAHHSGRYPGWFELEAELFKAGELAGVEKAIQEEIAKLANDGPTDAEMKRVRRAMIAAHIFSHEDIHELADTIAIGVVGHDMAFVQRYLPDLLKVTPEDVKRVTKQYLVDRKPVVIESVGKPKAAGGPAPGRPRAAFRDASPKARPGGNFDLKDAKTVVLDNGLKLILLENHRLPIVVAQAQVANVRLHEPADQVGVATLMGSLLSQGTKSRTGPVISQLIEDAGGALSMRSSGGTVKVLSDDTGLGLDLLLDCLMNPEFDKDDLESKRDQILTQLAEDEQTPEERASRAFLSAVYGEHPFARPYAKAAVLKKIQPKDVKRFHAKVVVPNNTVIAVAGDFDTEKVIADIKKRTAEWKAGKLARPAVAAPPEQPGFTQTIITDPEAAQLTVYLGHLGVKRNNPDFYKLIVMDNVLGTGPGFTDRLSATLRDRQGLAYTVTAKIAGSATEEPGTFTGYIGTFPDKFAEVRAGFLKEINRIRDELPDRGEVDAAKSYLTGSLAFTLTTCEQAADILLAADRYGFGANYITDYKKGVEAVTPQDVQAVARKYLRPDRLVLVAAGAIDPDGKPLKK